MSEIRVQEKRGPSPWLWILGLVGVAILIWAFTSLGGEDDLASETGAYEYSAEDVEGLEDGSGEPIATGVQNDIGDGGDGAEEFLMFAHETRAVEEAGQAHGYVIEGLRKLVAALEERTVDEGQGEELAAARESIDRLAESEADVAVHANLTREAFTSLAAVMAGMEGIGDATAVRQAAEAIQPDRPLLEQTREIEGYFEVAANQLSGSNR